jgi:hypothetical protein
MVVVDGDGMLRERSERESLKRMITRRGEWDILGIETEGIYELKGARSAWN